MVIFLSKAGIHEYTFQPIQFSLEIPTYHLADKVKNRSTFCQHIGPTSYYLTYK